VPPGTSHRFANVGSEPVEFLVISSPTTQGDRTNVGAGASAV
jgi:mannose-6-phosphate isomerase-like protein (cupin superfamily)